MWMWLGQSKAKAAAKLFQRFASCHAYHSSLSSNLTVREKRCCSSPMTNVLQCIKQSVIYCMYCHVVMLLATRVINR